MESSGTIRNLIDMGLAEMVGRKEVLGRPPMYGTSDQFLLAFGLRHLSDLPSIAELKRRFLDTAPAPADQPAPAPPAPEAEIPPLPDESASEDESAENEDFVDEDEEHDDGWDEEPDGEDADEDSEDGKI